jgi:hypothetical protein
LHAICARLLNETSKAILLYDKLEQGIKNKQKKKLVNITCSIMMLPLSNSKRAIESNIISFCELVRLYDPE